MLNKKVKVINIQFHTKEISYHRMYECPQKSPNLNFFLRFPHLFNAEKLSHEELVNNALENNLSS